MIQLGKMAIRLTPLGIIGQLLSCLCAVPEGEAALESLSVLIPPSAPRLITGIARRAEAFGAVPVVSIPCRRSGNIPFSSIFRCVPLDSRRFFLIISLAAQVKEDVLPPASIEGNCYGR